MNLAAMYFGGEYYRGWVARAGDAERHNFTGEIKIV